MHAPVRFNIDHFCQGSGGSGADDDYSPGKNLERIRRLVKVRPRKPGFVLRIEVYEKGRFSNGSSFRYEACRVVALQFAVRTTAWPERRSDLIPVRSAMPGATPTRRSDTTARAGLSCVSRVGRTPPASMRAIADCVVPITHR